MSILPLAVAGGIGYLIGKRPRSYRHYRSNIPATIDNIICQKLNYIFLAKEMKEYRIRDPWQGGYVYHTCNYNDVPGAYPSMFKPEYDTFREDEENDDESETDC